MTTHPSLVPVELLHAEADLEEPDDLTVGELAAILRDLVPILTNEELDVDVRVRALQALGTAAEATMDRFRLVRGALVKALNAGGMSYPLIGERFGVSGERARQWALDAPNERTNNP